MFVIRALGILACVLVVACVEPDPADILAEATFILPADVGIADNDEVVMGRPQPTCECQRGHWGRELQASICQSGLERPIRGCLYQRGKPIYWANEQRQEGPLWLRQRNRACP